MCGRTAFCDFDSAPGCLTGSLPPFFMPIFSNLQSRLTSLLLNFLFLCTAVLGASLIAMQRLLAWLDGYHPQLHQAQQIFQSWLRRHPKTITASLAGEGLLLWPTWGQTFPTNLW